METAEEAALRHGKRVENFLDEVWEESLTRNVFSNLNGVKAYASTTAEKSFLEGVRWQQQAERRRKGETDGPG
jgi:hypothetical protein